MAITVYSTPDPVLCLGMPVIYRVLSDSTDITTVIQAKLYYRRSEDKFFSLASTSVQQKAVGVDYFEFNFSSPLGKLLTSDYKTGSTELTTKLENCAIEWAVRFTEYYPSSLFVSHGTSAYATGFYFLNTNLYKTETQSVYTGSKWYLNGASTTNKFLTDSPSTQNLRALERIQLGFLTSYSDPIIKVRETKNNLSTATVTYEIPDVAYSFYVWDWVVSALNIVTAAPLVTGNEGYVDSLGAGGSYTYLSDNSVFFGGVTTIKDESLDTILPYLPLATSPSISIRMRSVTGTSNYDIYYYYSGSWHTSGLSTGSLSTTWSTFTQALPAGTTKVRVSIYTNNAYIAWEKVTYTSDNVLHKRCQFTLDTTHIDSDTKMLEVWAESTVSSNIVISETKTFLVDKTPISQDTTRFAVLNKRGEFDHFTYTQMHSEILTAEKTRSTKELPNTFTTKDRGTGVVTVNSEKIFTCFSEYIEAENLQWWATIIESKDVFVIVSDVQYAIDIITSSVVTYTHTDLVQLKIDWTYAYKR